MISTFYKHLDLSKCFILIVSFFALFSVQAVADYPSGLLSHGDFETGDIEEEFRRQDSNSVDWSLETNAPLSGERSLKATISGYGWMRSEHIPNEEQKWLSHIHLSGLVKSSAIINIEILATYEGNIYAERTSVKLNIPANTGVTTLNFDAVLHDKVSNKDKPVRTVAVYFRGTGEHIIDDIQLQFIEPNVAPTIKALTPNNTMHSIESDFIVTVSAKDTDGLVEQVEFKLDNLTEWNIGTKNITTTNEYSYDFGPLSAGTHTITYRAKDDKGYYSDEVKTNVIVLSTPEFITSEIIVNGSATTFSTETMKTHECITTGNSQKWSVNAVDSAGDNGLHELINIAKNSNEPVEIISANNCDIAPGIEQASNISIVYRQEGKNQIPILASVSSLLNFVARTQIELAPTVITPPAVEFKLVENNIETDQWFTANSSGVFYQYKFGLLNAGSSYTLTTKVRVDDEELSSVIHFNVYREGVTAELFKDTNGDFYFKHPSGSFIRLTKIDDNWIIDDTLTQADLIGIPLSNDYVIYFGEYGEGDKNSFELIRADENHSITFAHINGSYNYIPDLIGTSYIYDDYGRLNRVKYNGLIILDYSLDEANNRTNVRYVEAENE